MQQETIQYRLVWPGLLRLSHWVIAFGILFQILSAKLLEFDTVDTAFWYDWHIICGQTIMLAFLLRLILLFFPGSSHWRSLVPDKVQRQAMLQMIKFYISFARFPLPSWYAHNPFWLPLYILLYFVLAICLVTGLWTGTGTMIAGISIHKLHSVSSGFIIIFSLFHIVTAFLHDLKGKGAYISGMISGSRYFHIDKQMNADQLNIKGNDSVYVSMDSLEKDLKKKHK